MIPAPRASASQPDFPQGGGEMGALMRAFDWSKTPLGPVETWSLTLRMMVNFLLANRFPALLWWGPEYIQIYNDPYHPIPGAKHPRSLGQPGRECWAEIWQVLGPLVDTPFNGGPPTWIEDLELEIHRSDFTEETHFTVAYSPVPDETAPNGIGGVLATVHEITAKVIGERRTVILRDLGSRAAEAKTAEAACRTAAATLQKYAKDIPFALLYLIAPGGSARLAAASGVDKGCQIAPTTIDLGETGRGAALWPLAIAERSEQMQVVEDLTAFDGVPPGPWSDPPGTALVVPIRSNMAHELAGFLVAGISSRLKLDESYRDFLDLAAGLIATAVANARAYEQERKRAEALAEIDRAKTAFFSNVSHEFRTPLTLMLGPLEGLLSKTGALAPEDREQIETAHRNSLRLLKLVNSLLDFSRIEAGRVKAYYAPVDLAALTADLASNFRSAVEAAGLQLVVDCRPLGQPVYVDREMWEKIVLNLLSNAFKFTFEGAITVRLRADAGSAVLTLSDTGTGIPESELPHIFERFHRVKGAKGRSFEGTGIGLALIQELVKLHDGAVAVKSTVGEGTTFTITLPLGAAHLPKDRIGSAPASLSTTMRVETYTGELLDWLAGNDSLARSDMPAHSDGGAGPGTRASILLADDNADMREYVSRILGPSYDLAIATNGEEALELMRRNPPDLLLTDIMMPGIDGFELLSAVRSDARTQSLPVIFLSARAGEEARIEGLDAGADDYLVKPFTANELRARVRAHVEMARIRRESNARYRELAEQVSDGIFVADAQGRYIDSNEAAAAMLGYTREELLTLSVPDVLERGELERLPEQFELLKTGLRVQGDWRFRRKDGSVFVGDLIGRQFPDGHMQGVVRDVTQRRRAEEELRCANRDLEQFAFTASHDLQEPLRSIMIYSELLTKNYLGKLDGDAVEFLDYVRNGASRMEVLIRDILTYTRVTSLEKPVKPEDAAAALEAALANLAGVVSEASAQVSAGDLPSVPVHKTHLQQLFQNLVGNAVKYRRSGVPPLIRIAAGRQGDKWQFSVEDNGIGIEPEYQERVFRMFKRLHTGTEYSGTGIGLTICQRIVERYEGRIWVESEPGRGSTFYFTLPA